MLSHSSATCTWLCGLATYFFGNVFFILALGFAPASLCAALLATVVVANALIARFLLKERLQRCDYHGGALIVAGAAAAPASLLSSPLKKGVCELPPHGLSRSLLWTRRSQESR